MPETLDLEEQQKHCPECGLLFKDFGTEDSDVIEVEVQAHIRRYHRRRYLKTCKCEKTPAITTAPSTAKLIRKGKLGISVWVEILLHICRQLVQAVRRCLPELANVAQNWLEYKALTQNVDKFELEPEYLEFSDKFMKSTADSSLRCR